MEAPFKYVLPSSQVAQASSPQESADQAMTEYEVRDSET
jgi:hypothetical protein